MDNDIQAPIDSLRSFPGLEVMVKEAEGVNQTRADALLDIRSRAGGCSYVAEVRRSVTTTTLPAVLAQLERHSRHYNKPPLLLAPYLTPAVAERLLAERVEFADGAGNVFLDSPAAYVLVLGNKPEHKPSANGFTAADLELIYALLVAPRLRRATYREMSAATGVSLGKVSSTIRKLEEARHLYRARSGALMLRDPAQLHERWEFGYLEQLRPALRPSGWGASRNALPDLLARAENLEGVLVGGEYAADEMTRYLKPATLTLHVPSGEAKATAVGLRLPPADGDADVVLLERFVPEATLLDAGALDRFQGGDGGNLAHPLLARVELLALSDARLRKAADRLLSELILPALSVSGA